MTGAGTEGTQDGAGQDIAPGDNRRMPRWVPRAVVLFWAGALGAIAFRHVFHRLSSFLVLMLVALFVALAMEPGVNRLEARGWKRGRATLTILLAVIVVTLTFFGVVGTLVGQQVADLLKNSSTYVNDTVEFVNDTFNTNINPAEVNARIADPDGPVQEFIRSQQSQVFNLSVQALNVLFQSFTVVLFAFYLVADAPRLRRTICARLRPEQQERLLSTWDLAIKATAGYLDSRLLLAALSAFFHWIALQAIGTPAPIAMALWVGLVSQFLPVIGTYLAGVLPLLLTFLESPGRALAVVVFILVYQQVENYFFAPRITARTMELHAALAFGSALVGGAVLGPVGAILGLPFAAMVQGVLASSGNKHDVVDTPLVRVQEKKKPQPRRKRRSGGEPG